MKTNRLGVRWMVAAILATAVTLPAGPPEESEPGKIGYISPEIPEVTFPELKGEWQEGLVPDTLDLAERARLSINALTESADPDAGYEIWWHVLLNRKPPVLVHDFHDLNVQYKFQEALPLLRYVSGSDQNLEVDQAWPENLLRMQGEDGLIYMPFEGRPWAGFHADWLEQKGLKETQLASTVAQGGWLGNLALYYLLSGDEYWKERLEKLVDAVGRLMIYKDDYCYFPLMAVNPDTEVPQDRDVVDPDCTREASGAAAGWIIQGLSQAYLAIGYQPALDLARKLAIYMTRHSGCYDSEGRFRGVPHTHLHTRPISGLLEFAMASRDQDFIEYSKKSYEYARDSSGSATVGFFPSTPGAGAQYSAKTVQQVARYGVEGCTIADMAALAIKLSIAGAGDYWDDADRYLRNQFAEMQLLKGDFVNRLLPEDRYETWNRPEFESSDRTVERNIGSAMSLASPNDFVGHPLTWPDRPDSDHLFLMHCCTGNHARAIWYAWRHLLHHRDGDVKVNLLLNRVSPWADVQSYIPYEGQVDVRVKQPIRLQVRIPDWTETEKTVCRVNEQTRKVGWEGRYAQVGNVAPGDVVTLSFPIQERTVKEKMWGVDFNLVVKGNSVVFIDPPGKYYPFYQRDHYRQDRVRWVKRRQFVAAAPPLDWPY
ncbi:MAG: glycoside hydrolase family 127 protein [Acidobacteriota bacterium]|nr:glycoside hydrolase family 127 protein [Acidobacteriota bacterium]